MASLLLPGTAQLLKGKMGWGIALLFLWFAALASFLPDFLGPAGRLVGIDLRSDLLAGPPDVPAPFNTNPLVFIAIAILPIIWCVGNTWRWRRREA